MDKILIVEDDDEIAELEKDYLEINGFFVNIIQDGNLVLDEIKNIKYDLIILDIMLPNKNGYEICKEIRDLVDIPILMVTSKTDSIDKIRGLGIGGDDYISKPFDPSELVARVKSHINRYKRIKNSYSDSRDIISIGNIEINTKSWKVFKDSKEIKLPNREFEILKFLAINPNIVFTKEEIFEKIWGCDYINDNATVAVHINRIRDKIELDSSNPQIIETIWGVGYRLNL